MDIKLLTHQRIGILGRHFDEIAQYIIMFDLERRNTGCLGIGLLQARDNSAAFIAQATGLIQFRPPALGDKPAIACQQWRLIPDSPFKVVDQIGQLYLVGQN